MAKTRGGTKQFLGKRVVRFYTNGKRANDSYGLAQHVGRIVRRVDVARKRAVVSTSRRAGPMAKANITAVYSIAAAHVTNRVHVYDTGDTLHVNASVLKFPLALFHAQWGGPFTSGATAAVRLGGRHTYPGTFMAAGRFRSEKLDQVYRRLKGKKKRMVYGRYKGKVREQIVALRGPSTYDMLIELSRETAMGKSGAGAYHRQLRAFYISELRRLYALEG